MTRFTLLVDADGVSSSLAAEGPAGAASERAMLESMLANWLAQYPAVASGGPQGASDASQATPL